MSNLELEPESHANLDLIASAERIALNRDAQLQVEDNSRCFDNLSSTIKTTPGDYYFDEHGEARKDLNEKIRLISQGKY